MVATVSHLDGDDVISWVEVFLPEADACYLC